MKTLTVISTSAALVIYVITYAINHLVPALQPVLHALGM